MDFLSFNTKNRKITKKIHKYQYENLRSISNSITILSANADKTKCNTLHTYPTLSRYITIFIQIRSNLPSISGVFS